ncbi:DUF4430 domain-containing protein [Candidatus Giovannonibacteria bacterium]|nr:DUF4430 domain-containing protein [Candidatus Giovannonibacteria bacterium]
MSKKFIYSIIALILIILAAFIVLKKEILAPTEPISKNEISNNGSEENNSIKVKLSINGEEPREISVPKSSTVYRAMEIAASSSIISFKSKTYAGLGNFIDEINGVKGSNNKFWIYYVNGKSATVGASQYVLSPGDLVEWKFENAK